MSKASRDGAHPADVGRIPSTGSSIAARRRALKVMLGSAPVVLTFPSITSASSSSTCQMNLDNVTPRPDSSLDTIISDTNMGTPSWFRLAVTKQIYESDAGNVTLYTYLTGTTTWYYVPPNFKPVDTRPAGYDGKLVSQTTVYVLADVSNRPPYEPDFDGGGTYSTWSCMMSMPGTPA